MCQYNNSDSSVVEFIEILQREMRLGSGVRGQTNREPLANRKYSHSLISHNLGRRDYEKAIESSKNGHVYDKSSYEINMNSSLRKSNGPLYIQREMTAAYTPTIQAKVHKDRVTIFEVYQCRSDDAVVYG